LSRRRHGDKRWRHTPHAIVRYRLHNDWFRPEEPGYADKMLGGGQRRISIFIYLQQPTAGGCTWFPHLGARGVAFAPVVGNGVMWCAPLSFAPSLAPLKWNTISGTT
jgi:hypothetical protein